MFVYTGALLSTQYLLRYVVLSPFLTQAETSALCSVKTLTQLFRELVKAGLSQSQRHILAPQDAQLTSNLPNHGFSCMTFPKGDRNNCLLDTGRTPTTDQSMIPFQSSLINQWIYQGYLQEHEQGVAFTSFSDSGNIIENSTSTGDFSQNLHPWSSLPNLHTLPLKSLHNSNCTLLTPQECVL